MSSASAPKPVVSAAGDVELARSLKSNGSGSGLGPSSSRGSRLSSLWSDMFHEGLVGSVASPMSSPPLVEGTPGEKGRGVADFDGSLH